MAQPTNTFDSYDSIGNREDLLDNIYNIAPMDTPFMSAIGMGPKAESTYVEWQTDTLGSPSDNKVIEGDDATTNAVVPTVRLGNYTQISDKVPLITGTQEAIRKAGRKQEMAYQLAKLAKELKTDMEYACIGVNNAQVAGNATTARELGSVQSYIATNTSAGASGADPTGDGTDARTDGTQRVFTEDLLKDVLQACYLAGGNPSLLFAGAFNKRVLSTFNGNATKTVEAATKKISAGVDVYDGDFHTLRVVPSRILRSREVLAIDPAYWKLRYLRPFVISDLAKTGDSMRKQMVVEYTLQASQEAASGIVADLTTS